jgi:hypothetical protein
LNCMFSNNNFRWRWSILFLWKHCLIVAVVLI